jgi:hypothetical protein
MQPKKERIEHEENGARVERTTYDDPETRTHVEEVKIEKTEEEPEKEPRSPESRPAFLLNHSQAEQTICRQSESDDKPAAKFNQGYQF